MRLSPVMRNPVFGALGADDFIHSAQLLRLARLENWNKSSIASVHSKQK